MTPHELGGKEAARKNTSKDPNFYRRIGAIGGSISRGGGFTGNSELARVAGHKGGLRKRGVMCKTTCVRCRLLYKNAMAIYEQPTNTASFLGISIAFYSSRKGFQQAVRHKLLGYHRTKHVAQ